MEGNAHTLGGMASQVTLKSPRIVAAIMCFVAVLSACTPPRLNADRSVPQNRPYTTQGLVVFEDYLWVTDSVGRQLLRIDTDSGAIVERWGTAEGLLRAPDDVVGAVVLARCFSLRPSIT